MKQKIYEVDSIDGYNKWYGRETLHPLVTVIDIKESPEWLNGATLRYGVYGIFLKQGAGCSVRYGREKYDYQEGTIVTHAPDEVFTVEWKGQSSESHPSSLEDGRVASDEGVANKDLPMPPSRGLLFHPDLLYGTPLGKKIKDYSFFQYGDHESLHLSQAERTVIMALMDQIETEMQHAIDRHSQTLITDTIGLMLDYCLRYYDRQFITRHKVNSEVFLAFQQQLREYFVNDHPERHGLPSVAYFADKACLSPNYFGDLISKESGTTAQRHIQDAVIERSKQLLIETRMPVSEIAYQLGFEYPQHFSRLFKSRTGMTPNEYRLTA
jgi:AraC-like DNA-binding protein